MFLIKRIQGDSSFEPSFRRLADESPESHEPDAPTRRRGTEFIPLRSFSSRGPTQQSKQNELRSTPRNSATPKLALRVMISATEGRGIDFLPVVS
jgi:hypothetical protein